MVSIYYNLGIYSVLVSIYYNLGIYSVLVSIYAGEVGSPELRGVLGAICQLFVILGKIDIDTAVGTSCIVDASNFKLGIRKTHGNVLGFNILSCYCLSLSCSGSSLNPGA